MKYLKTSRWQRWRNKFLFTRYDEKAAKEKAKVEGIAKKCAKLHNKEASLWEKVFYELKRDNPDSVLKNYETYEDYNESPYVLTLHKPTGKMMIRTKEEAVKENTNIPDSIKRALSAITGISGVKVGYQVRDQFGNILARDEDDEDKMIH